MMLRVKQEIGGLAQGHNTVPLMRHKLVATQSQVEYSTTEPLHSSFKYEPAHEITN